MPIDITKNWRWKRVRSGASCAKQSFRVKKAGKTKLVRFCCPKGKWKSGYCHGGMTVQAVGKRRSR